MAEVDLFIAGRTYQVACRDGEEENLRRGRARWSTPRAARPLPGLGTLANRANCCSRRCCLPTRLIDRREASSPNGARPSRTASSGPQRSPNGSNRSPTPLRTRRGRLDRRRRVLPGTRLRKSLRRLNILGDCPCPGPWVRCTWFPPDVCGVRGFPGKRPWWSRHSLLSLPTRSRLRRHAPRASRGVRAHRSTRTSASGSNSSWPTSSNRLLAKSRVAGGYAPMPQRNQPAAGAATPPPPAAPSSPFPAFADHQSHFRFLAGEPVETGPWAVLQPALDAPDVVPGPGAGAAGRGRRGAERGLARARAITTASLGDCASMAPC